ncbi:MAG: RagB/SusD family nutrient uptake outer membrane protein [Reichenbachiella sp.]|uniref:RagB/SusD family nutrient uptake outer membrane protein n=2 Tax=Reichenbachiella sp. TaxID=2184521 RepID=UPI003264FB4F
MKKYKYILFSFSLIWSFSCDDKLEITPQDVLVAEVAISNLDDLETALTSVYSALRGDGLYQESMVYLPDLMADNLRIGDSNGGALRTEANWQYSSGDDIDTWEEAYRLIFRANLVIENAARFEDGTQKNRILGQALALRALSHFDLLRYYGADYGRNSASKGVPVIEVNEVGKPARNTVAEVYDKVFEDLLQARTLLGDVDKDVQENGPYFMDQKAVNALLARVSLYAGEWQNAVDYATSVISSSTLANPADYAAMWANDADAEVIFSVIFSTPDEGRLGSRLFDINTNRSTITLTADVAELYDAANDVRFSSFVLVNPDANPGDDVYLPIKYPGRGGERGLNNAKVLRVSEMYLIRAEAYTNIAGQDAAAMADLNALRTSRITGYAPENLSGAALADAIEVERRKELVAEGHRWFDLRRLGKGVTRGADCRGLTTSCDLAAGNFRFAFPIPQDEILANPNMVQNDQY